MVVLGDAQIVEDGQAIPEPDVLKGARNPKAVTDGDDSPAMFLPVKRISPSGPIEPAHQVEDRGLARPIGTNEPQELASLKGEIEVMNGAEPAEKVGEIPDFQKCHLALLLLWRKEASQARENVGELPMPHDAFGPKEHEKDQQQRDHHPFDQLQRTEELQDHRKTMALRTDPLRDPMPPR